MALRAPRGRKRRAATHRVGGWPALSSNSGVLRAVPYSGPTRDRTDHVSVMWHLDRAQQSPGDGTDPLAKRNNAAAAKRTIVHKKT